MVPAVNPVTARDFEDAESPEKGDSDALTSVDPLKFEAVAYSNDTVVEALFGFTEPERVADVTPTKFAELDTILGAELDTTVVDVVDVATGV